MATIKQFGGTGMASRWASIILESDNEAKTLPVSTLDATKNSPPKSDEFLYW